MAEDELKAAKKARRNEKSTFTRSGNWLTNIVDVKRPESEVRDTLSKVEEAYNDLVVKHENYTTLIDDDEDFEEAESWMNECQGSFMNYVMRAKMYLDSLVSPEKQTLQNGEDKEKTASSQSSMIGMSNMQSATPSKSDGPHNDEMQIIQSIHADSVQVITTVQTTDHTPINTEGNVNNTTSTAGTEKVQKSPIEARACTFKLEKPKLPVFAGNVRDYAIFRSDFKHAIEAKCSKRDSITVLRTCLREKPLE